MNSLAGLFGALGAIAIALVCGSPVRAQGCSGSFPVYSSCATGPTSGLPGPRPARISLTANTTYYVRTDGNDGNDGLSNSAARAWRTPQRAIDFLKTSVDLAGNVATIQLADGAYTSTNPTGSIVVVGPFVGTQTPTGDASVASCPVIVQGNSVAPGNVVVSNTTATATIVNSAGTFICYKDFSIGRSLGPLIRSGGGTVVRIANMIFGPSVGSSLIGTHGGVIEAVTGTVLTWSGSPTDALFEGSYQGSTYLSGATIALAADISAAQFAWAYYAGQVHISGLTYRPGTYSFTGKRFAAEAGGNISIGTGGNLAYLPGTSPGTITSGGSYDTRTYYTSPLSINSNAAPSIPSPAGTMLHLAAPDGAMPQGTVTGLGAPSSWSCRRANGTGASSTALRADELLCSFAAIGYDGANYIPTGGVTSSATQNWSPGSTGSRVGIFSTPNGSATIAERIGVEQDGGITIPASVPGGSKGAGSLNAVALYQAGNQITSVGIAAPGQIPGTGASDSATAGHLGEFISSSIAADSVAPLADNAAANVAQVSLTAGDWDCRGNVISAVHPATVMTQFQGWVSTASATFPTPPNGGGLSNWVGSATGVDSALSVAPTRFLLSSTTTVYLSALSRFTTNTNGAYGFLGCRRMR
jgi:hypothetical protein